MRFLTLIYFFFYSFSFKYHGDKILFYPFSWIHSCFARLFKFRPRYPYTFFFSTSYGEYFNHFQQYWQLVGKKHALIEVLQRPKHIKLIGHTWEETLAKFTRSEYPDTPVVIFWDINQAAMPRIINLVPNNNLSVFNEDIVCIPCRNREEAKKIVKATPKSMAEVFVAQDGVIIYTQDEVGGKGFIDL